MRQDALEPTHPWRALFILTALFLAVSLAAAPAADAARPSPTGGQVTFTADCDVTTSAIQIPANGKRIFRVTASIYGPGFFNGVEVLNTGSALNGEMTNPVIASRASASSVSQDANATFTVYLFDRRGNGVYIGTATTPATEGVGCTTGSPVDLVWSRA